MAEIKYPFGAADIQTPADAETINVDITDQLTILTMPTLGGNRTLNLSASEELMPGAVVFIDQAQNGTGRDLAFGSGGSTIAAPDLTGVANDRDTIALMWNGSAFVGGAWAKVVDAA